ncbi:hypothetical protein A1QC_00035 [Vibrio rumoiensis 1S-45]|uniref:DUF11 domain-containing protein n=1 Tax=Vibrio rumoiensis 1S-45 TaxID=1188252 RepID=A0A1E5E6V4_9VIBR|nr:hypothetical protein A1QC_00035 [Vibrio rumoiensis 1S-45]
MYYVLCSLFLAVFSLSAHAELSVQLKSVSDSTYYEAGEPISYELTIRNTDQNNAVDDFTVNATVADQGSLNDVGSSSKQNFRSKPGTIDISSSGFTATNAHLSANGYITYTLDATVGDDVVNPIAVNVGLKDSAGNSLPVTSDSTTSVTLTPAPYVYSVSVTAAPQQYTVSKNVAYNVTVKNDGDYAIKGLKVDAPFASLKVADTTGQKVTPFSAVNISASGSASGTNAGTFDTTGDLKASGVTIAVGDSVTYQVNATVANNIVGDITTAAVAVIPARNQTQQASLTVPPATPAITLTNVLNKSGNYLVGDTFSYSVQVSNTGGSIAHDYQVQLPISKMQSLLANDMQKAEDSTDLSGTPYITWTNHVENIGADSTSELSDNDTQNVDLDDKVSIYPNQSIEYTITVNVSPVSIDTIPAITATVLDNNAQSVKTANANTLTSEKVLNTDSSNISRTKVVNDDEYVPGEEVKYTITAENSNNKYFANNIQVLDSMSCIQTEQSDGTTGNAFSEWKLDVKSKTGEGTDAGAFAYGTWTKGDINVVPDLSPSGKVVYTLTAKVAKTSVGTILDNGANCGDNVSEGGTGIDMPAANIYAKKEVSSHYYSAGHGLSYNITVTNSGDGFALDIPVVDELSKVTTTNVYGKQVPAYYAWTITAKAYNEDGSLNRAADTGIPVSINSPTDLNVKADLPPHSYIVYSIDTTTYPTANAEIRNQVVVDDTVYADSGSIPYSYNVGITKKVNGSDWSNYSRGDSQVAYTITVTNPTGNGFASNVKIDDEISKIQGELLGSTGTNAAALKSWKIESTVKAIDTKDIFLKIFADPGEYPTGFDGSGTRTAGDIHIGSNGNKAAQIPAGVEIVYTITADIDRTSNSYADSPIVWGQFSNTATVSADQSSYSSGFSHSSTVTTNPKVPKLVIIKTADEPNFVPGEKLTFNVEVRNIGDGYANNAHVTDAIGALNFFDSWSITAEKDGLGGTTTGSFANNQDIDTTVDIAPARGDNKNGEKYGYVIYHITGIVKQDYSPTEVSNTATVYDPQSDTEHKSSAEVAKDGAIEKLNVSIVKSSNTHYVPGEDHVYTIYLKNNGDKDANNLTFSDPIEEIKDTLANKKDGHFTDFEDQSPFESWSVDYDDGNGFGSYSQDPITTRLSLAADDGTDGSGADERQITIRAKVLDSAISKITNDAYIIKNKGEATEDTRMARDESIRADSHGYIAHEVNENNYSPGDTLVYTVTVTSKTGYYNNVAINEAINDLQVELLDGSTGNPFYNVKTGKNEFTVQSQATDTHDGGTTDGKQDGTVAGNKDINTTVDVGPGDKVVFTITGQVRPDATGTINFNDIDNINDDNHNVIVQPYPYQLTFDKTTKQVNYSPGGVLTYYLTIQNIGKGNARDIPVLDEISKIMVDTTTGGNVAAFTPDWTITTQTEGDNVDYVNAGDYSNGEDLNTTVDLPMGSTLTYTVKATVVDEANGEIVNALKVDGDTVSTKTKPDAQRYNFTKEITHMYEKGVNDNTPGNELSNKTRYMPGGWIEYTVRAENLNDVNIADISIEDDIADITTDYFNGKTGPAFDHWQITATSDSSPISDAGTVADNQNIKTNFTLAANSIAPEGTSYVQYVIKAHVDEKAVGSILNVASFENGTFEAKADVANMISPSVTFDKKAYTPGVSLNDDGTVSTTTAKTTYSQNSSDEDNQVDYVISLKNTSNGTEYGKHLTDQVSSILAKIAEDANTDGSDPTDTPFKAAPVITMKASQDNDGAGTTITLPNSFSGTDIDSDVSIAPQGWINFLVKGNIADNTLGSFTNTATYNGSNKSAALNPLTKNVTVEKTITSIGGNSYSNGDPYLPGQEVEYKVVVHNDSDGWANDVNLVDDLSAVQVEVIGGGRQSAFSHTEITNTTGSPLAGETYVPGYTATDSDLNMQVDIAPQDTLTFTIKGTIRDDALGVIDANTFKADETSSSTPTIPPTAAQVSGSKTLFSTSADPGCTDSTGCKYELLGQVEYDVTVKNAAGAGTANDIKVIDAINNIKTSGGQTAFNHYSVEVFKAPTNSSDYSISGNYDGNVSLNATVDLKAGEEIVFHVKGSVAPNAQGTISNTASVDNKDVNDTIVLEGEYTAIVAQKSTPDPTYVPGGDVTYHLDFANVGKTDVNINIDDAISSFKVKTADGTDQQALDSWTISAEVVQDANSAVTNIDALNGLNNQDINNAVITLASREANPEGNAATVVRVTITGKVRNDAIGKFTNDMTYSFMKSDGSTATRTAKLAQGYITPKPGKLTVTKTATRDPAEYSIVDGDPDNTINFDVEVTNSPDGGYAVNTNIKDAVDSIKTDLANQAKPGSAIDGKWTVSTPTLGANTKQVGTPIDDTTGFAGIYNIHPGESVKVSFSGKVVPLAVGDITNTVAVSSESADLDPASVLQATYMPKTANIGITKTVDKPQYSIGSDGEVLTYTVTVQNTGGGWAKDVAITDPVSTIETDVSGDTQGPAFDSSSFVVSAIPSKVTGQSAVLTKVPAVENQDLDMTLDLAPNEQVVVTFQAKLNNNDVGTVTNEASVTYNGDTQTKTAMSVPSAATVKITKAAVNALGNKIDDPTYEPDQYIHFQLKVENTSESFANNVRLQDAIGEIMVDNNLGNSEKAFASWVTKVTQTDNRSTATDFTGGSNEDLDATFDLAPESSATFTITAKVQPNAVSDIENTATLTPEGSPTLKSETIVVKPEASTYVAHKVSEELRYEPDQSLGFLVTVTNNSKAIINDMIVTDDMNSIQTDYVDGTRGTAFKPRTTSFTVKSQPDFAQVIQKSDTEYQVDIPPGKSVVFEARGDVNGEAVGEIINTAYVTNNGETKPYSSNVVNSAPSIIDAELTTDAKNYVPGEPVVYHYIVKNSGSGLVKNVYVEASIAQSLGELIDGTESPSFTHWDITAKAHGRYTTTGTVENDKDIFTSVDIDQGGYVDYTITATTNEDLTSNIDLLGYYIDVTDGLSKSVSSKAKTLTSSASSYDSAQKAIDGQVGEVSVLQLPPVEPELKVTKTSDKSNYESEDDTVTYTLTAENPSLANASNVDLTDAISELVASSGNPVFTSWDIRGTEYDEQGNIIDNSVFNDTDKDLDVVVNLKSQSRNRFEFTIVGTLNKGLNDDITNTFVATLETGTKFTADNTVHIERIPDNTGELTVTKTAFKDEAQVGDVVEYEVTVSNDTEADFGPVVVQDRMPGGFQYVEESSEITLPGADGEFDTTDDITMTAEPTATRVLQYPGIDLLSGDSVRIRYLLRVNIGATFGDYVNTAFATVNNQLKSNLASATVKVTPDKLFDTASIIGKVFQDDNGDGYQADATADDIEVKADISKSDYIAHSTILMLKDNEKSVADKSGTAPINHGVTIDSLMGISRNRTLPHGNKAVLEFKTKTKTPFDLHVVSDNGTNITLTADGKVISKDSGDKEEGLSSENLDVTRKLFRSGDHYVWEITIENKGFYEEGIPGVRLITVEGIVIETDQYGRYHVPDQWVVDKKGKNFLVKLDTDSLPTGMKVISENPKVLRISPNALAKFNFSVQNADQKGGK